MSWQQSRRLGAPAMSPACLAGVPAPLFSNCVTLDPSHSLSGLSFLICRVEEVMLAPASQGVVRTQVNACNALRGCLAPLFLWLLWWPHYPEPEALWHMSLCTGNLPECSLSPEETPYLLAITPSQPQAIVNLLSVFIYLPILTFHINEIIQ